MKPVRARTVLALCVALLIGSTHPATLRAGEAETPPSPEPAPPAEIGRPPEPSDVPPQEPHPAVQAETQSAAAVAPPALLDHARTLPPSGKKKEPGLAALAWTSEPHGNPARLENESPPPAAPADCLAIELLGGPKSYTSIRCEGTWKLKRGDGAHTRLVIYNATAGALRMSLAYSAGERFEWHESPPLTLQPGWNEVEIDQGARRFKSERSDWRHAARLPDEPCRAVNLVFHTGARTGRLFVESLRLDAEPLKR